jgi:hypothetical protein
MQNIEEAIEACLGDLGSEVQGMTFVGVRDLEVAVP